MTNKQIDHFNIGHEKRAAVTRLSTKLFITKNFIYRSPQSIWEQISAS